MEREFHHWLKNQLPATKLVELGVGDDAAVLSWPTGASVVITTDAIADGTHFDRNQHDLSRIGRKLIAVNLSDIAAMGAKPVAAVLTFNVPQGFTLPELQQLFLGCQQICDEFGVVIVGGDTNTCHGPLNVSATLIGCPVEIPGPLSVWKMSSAQAGDEIVVSGEFGGSLLGHHFDFLPEIRLAEYLVKNYQVHAATDISDSLTLDLAAVATQSGLGVELRVDQIPIAAAAYELADRDGKSALAHALTDGEDFGLLLAVPPLQWQRLKQDCAD